MKEQLKFLRKSKNLTQEEISDILGVKLSTYQKYERDVISPPYDTLIKIVKFYGVSSDYLLGIEKEPTILPTMSIDNIELTADEIFRTYDNMPDTVKSIVIDVLIKLGESAKNALEKNKKSTPHWSLPTQEQLASDTKAIAREEVDSLKLKDKPTDDQFSQFEDISEENGI